MAFSKRLLASFLFLLLSGLDSRALGQQEQQLREIISRIRSESAADRTLVLKHELDGTPVDREPLPAQDAVTGAVNIAGETPRDKIVTDLLKKIDKSTEELGKAWERQSEGAARVATKKEGMGDLAVKLLLEEQGKVYIPLQLDVSINKTQYGSWQSSLGSTLGKTIEILHTVLPKGTIALLVKGTFAAATAATKQSVYSPLTMDTIVISQRVDIELDSSTDVTLRLTQRNGDYALEKVAHAHAQE